MSVSEVAHVGLTCALWDVAVEDDDVLAFELGDEVVGFCLGLREDDGAVVGIVLGDEALDFRETFVPLDVEV